MESPRKEKTKALVILIMTSSTMMKKRRKRRKMTRHNLQIHLLPRRRKKQRRLSLRVVKDLILITILPTNSLLNLCTAMIQVAVWVVKDALMT